MPAVVEAFRSCIGDRSPFERFVTDSGALSGPLPLMLRFVPIVGLEVLL